MSEGGVASTKLVEGLEVDISGTSITLAKLQASHANIRGEDVSIVAAYCRKLDVEATGASAVDAIRLTRARPRNREGSAMAASRCSGAPGAVVLKPRGPSP